MDIRSTTTSASLAGMPQVPAATDLPEQHAPASLPRLEGLPSERAPTAGQAVASRSPRAALPAGLPVRSGDAFLQAVRGATLAAQPLQRAAVMEYLDLPDAQLKEIINSQDENGDSALHMLAKSTSLAHMKRDAIAFDAPDLLRQVLEKGADPGLRNHEGKRADEYVGTDTHVYLVARVGYELAQTGPVNRMRLDENRVAYASDPEQAFRLADARQGAAHALRAAGRMLGQGPNRLTPYLPEDLVRYAGGQPTPGLMNSPAFFGPEEHARYSLFEPDGRVSAHVAHGIRGEGSRDGNNLILRFEPAESGRLALKGIVFPSRLLDEDGRKQYHPHTIAYGGGPFAFAGEISANADGLITSVSNKSGHNQPDPFLLAGVTLYMQSQGMLAEDFTMAITLRPSKRTEEYKGAQAFAKAREMLAQRWPEINTEARAAMGRQLAELKDQLRAAGGTTSLQQGPERADLSRQRSQVYARLEKARTEHRFLKQLGYDPATGAMDPHAAPPGSYREEGPATLVGHD